MLNFFEDTKKAPVGAFFVSVISILLSLSPAWASDCELQGGEWAELGYVYDGDTLRLKDGRKIRLLGVNTPELARKTKVGKTSAQALSLEAKAAVKHFFIESKRLRLVYGEQRYDPYKRTLAHVFNEQGQSLERYLLASGLAFHIAIAPNLSLLECFSVAAESARLKRLGVWSERTWRPLNAVDIQSKDAGFRRVSGRILSISTGDTWWLEFEGKLVLKLSAADRRAFPQFDWGALKGREVEVSGWLIDRSNRAARKGYKPFMMSLRSPYAVRVID